MAATASDAFEAVAERRVAEVVEAGFRGHQVEQVVDALRHVRLRGIRPD
ncbi:hypothetical protein ACU686_32815 [Yinghuangia aomiensis]